MNKKIITDVILNLAASIIPIFILQFLILPRTATHIGAESYGQLLAVIAFINLISASFGSVLNNSKLIHYGNYDRKKINSDFNIMLVFFLAVNLIFIGFGLTYYGKDFDKFTLISLIFIASCLLITTYLSVEFRIDLNFRNILMSGMTLFSGYLVGFILFLITGYWSWIYLLGYSLNLIFILIKTDTLKDNFSKSTMFHYTFRETIILLGSGFLVSVGAYIDKLLIFPLLGGEAVSIYYISTILGKTILLGIGPITSVLLSYFAHMKRFSNQNFKLLLTISIVIGGTGYGIVILVSRPLLELLYPAYASEALKYVYITTLSTILTIIASAINPVLLKFMKAKWQFVINIVYIFIYILFSLILLASHGLMGFCMGILIANAVKLITMVVIYSYTNKESLNNKNSEGYEK